MKALAVLTLLAVGVTTASAQDTDQIRDQNWQSLSHAMAQVLLDRDTGTAVPPNEFVTGLSDLDLDGNIDLLVYRAPDTCTGQPCGHLGYSLLKDTFVQVMPDIPGLRVNPSMQIAFGSARRFGYLDMVYGPVHLTWDRTGYVEPQSLPPAPVLDTSRFTAICEQASRYDWAFDNNGVDHAEGRRAICGCLAARASSHGASQDQLDAFGDYIDPAGLDSGAYNAAYARVAPFMTEADNLGRGCLVERGWSNWDWQLGNDDEKQPQQPVNFAGFIPVCTSQDWLVGNSKVATPDRALAMCGCLGRKLAARGFDQAALDGLTRFYNAEIGEDELAALRVDAMAASDDDLERCVGRLPAR